MNCNLASGILDTQAVSPAKAPVVRAGQEPPGRASFSSFLGDQHPIDSFTDAPAASNQPRTSAAAARPFTGYSQRIPESSMPICQAPSAGQPPRFEPDV
ncbi:MAG: hypothetical protein QM757_19615 [Paludibaculum sp.]